MLTRREHSAAGLQFQADKYNRERLRTFFPTTYLHLRRAGIRFRWRKHDKRSRRSSQNQTRQTADHDMIGIGVSTKPMPAKFDAGRKRSHSRSGSNRKRYRWNLRGSENGAGDASGAALNGRLDDSRIERRDEERAPGRVGRDSFAIGEGNLHAGREPA